MSMSLAPFYLTNSTLSDLLMIPKVTNAAPMQTDHSNNSCIMSWNLVAKSTVSCITGQADVFALHQHIIIIIQTELCLVIVFMVLKHQQCASYKHLSFRSLPVLFFSLLLLLLFHSPLVICFVLSKFYLFHTQVNILNIFFAHVNLFLLLSLSFWHFVSFTRSLLHLGAAVHVPMWMCVLCMGTGTSRNVLESCSSVVQM